MKTSSAPLRTDHANTSRPRLIRIALSTTLLTVLISGCAEQRRDLSAPTGKPVAQASHDDMDAHMLEMRWGLPVPAFSLTDQHGRRYTRTQMQGKWTVLFFGYTHCPDFCPTTLTALAAAQRRLQREDPAAAECIQVVFVSLDPFRDTPILADYISHFDPRFIALSGSTGELRRLTKLLGAGYEYADLATGKILPNTRERPADDYGVNHSAAFYLFDERARLISWMAPPHTAERIAALFGNFVRR